jgi:uncharacterized iron-regulated membrane protein
MANSLYLAVWRWHFYAGLLVLPLLIWLALTGGAYLFKQEIDGFFHHELKTVPTAQEDAKAPSVLVAAALAAHPGRLLKYTPSAAPLASAEVGVATVQGGRLTVYLDPYRAQVLGALPEGGSVAWTIRKLHSLKYFGPVARGAIEIAAGWSILLVLSGIYLWWPRGRSGGVVTLRGGPGKRVFWRDLHAVTGVFVGAALLFLALTGMPWSVVWGKQVNQWANGQNFGYPAGVRVQLPMSTQRLAEGGPTAWSLEQARLPTSAHEGHGEPAPAHSAGPAPGALDLDTIVGIVERLGLAKGYSVSLPTSATGVYTASVYPHDVARQRVVHLDQYTGKPLLDMTYADYGPLGRWLEWGIGVHMGQQFGAANQWGLLVVCLAIVLLCVSAATMWWKRRPAGGLGVPPQPSDRRVLRVVVALMLLGGIAFPLMGASLLLMLLLEWGARTYEIGTR